MANKKRYAEVANYNDPYARAPIERTDLKSVVLRSYVEAVIELARLFGPLVAVIYESESSLERGC